VERLISAETRPAVKEKLERNWKISRAKLEAEKAGGYGDI
jgi:hypothetical protein